VATCDPVSTTSLSGFHEIRYKDLTSRASEFREYQVWKSHFTKERKRTSNIHSIMWIKFEAEVSSKSVHLKPCFTYGRINFRKYIPHKRS